MTRKYKTPLALLITTSLLSIAGQAHAQTQNNTTAPVVTSSASSAKVASANTAQNGPTPSVTAPESVWFEPLAVSASNLPPKTTYQVGKNFGFGFYTMASATSDDNGNLSVSIDTSNTPVQCGLGPVPTMALKNSQGEIFAAPEPTIINQCHGDVKVNVPATVKFGSNQTVRSESYSWSGNSSEKINIVTGTSMNVVASTTVPTDLKGQWSASLPTSGLKPGNYSVQTMTGIGLYSYFPFTVVDNLYYAKYSWSPDIFSVDFSTNPWTWKKLSWNDFVQAGYPHVNNAGWIQGTQLISYPFNPNIYATLNGVSHQLSFSEWSAMGYRPASTGPVDVVKYSWSPDIYAVSFPPTGNWSWTHLNMNQWASLGYKQARTAGWIDGTRLTWGANGAIYATLNGTAHHLTFSEWAAMGYRTP